MKKIIIILMLIAQVNIISAQEYKFISKELHLMTETEMIKNQVQITNNVLMYDAKGNTIDATQINNIMVSGNFFPQVYGNKNHQAKAIVFRATTKEEKKKIKTQMQRADPNTSFVSGKFAKDFTATDINGNEITLSKLKGKVVVLNFWFTQCKPCVTEMPKLNKLVKKYKNVEFISITFNKKEVVEKFLKNHTFNYKHIVNSDPIIEEYESAAFPTHIIIDQKGEIIFRKVGDYIEEMDIKIGLLLKQ